MDSSNKTICILPRILGLGGPNTFQSNLIQVLRTRGNSISHDPTDPANSSILVIGGTKQIASLKQAQKAGVRVIQRLNGMNWVHRKKYTGIRHFLRAEYGNLILAAIRKMADGIIYQSEFARGWWEREKGRVDTYQSVIHNGVDLQVFSPERGEPPRDYYRLLVVEGHHGGGYEQGLLTAVKLVSLLNKRLDKRTLLTVVGEVPDDLKRLAEGNEKNIEWLGVVKRDEIPSIDCASHILFSADINAACPNSVIEAMACGLPVISYDTGALPELVGGDSGRIARYGTDVWKLEPPDIYALADAAQAVLADREYFSRNARKRVVDHFDIQAVVDRYLTILLPDEGK